MQSIISSTKASNNFGAMLDKVSSGDNMFVVTRMGKPKGVFLGVNQFREIVEVLETFDELQDSNYLKGVLEARKDIEVGDTLTLEELDEALGL